MADEEDKKAKGDAKEERSDDSKTGGTKIGIITWVIVAVIVFICAGSGFFIGRVLGGAGGSEKAKALQAENSYVAEDSKTDDSKKDSKNCWYYDLEPVVANLDEPGVTRYVRVTITLEISSNLEAGEGVKLLESKKPILNNWLTIYLAGLSLEDVRGDRSLKRIQSQILDAFNENLFPDAKPQVKHVLFKEFAIQ